MSRSSIHKNIYRRYQCGHLCKAAELLRVELESEEGVDYCHMLYWEMCLIVHMKDKNPHRYGHNRFAGAPVKYVKNRLADALAYYEHREEQRRARSAIARA